MKSYVMAMLVHSIVISHFCFGAAELPWDRSIIGMFNQCFTIRDEFKARCEKANKEMLPNVRFLKRYKEKFAEDWVTLKALAHKIQQMQGQQELEKLKKVVLRELDDLIEKLLETKDACIEDVKLHERHAWTKKKEPAEFVFSVPFLPDIRQKSAVKYGVLEHYIIISVLSYMPHSQSRDSNYVAYYLEIIDPDDNALIAVKDLASIFEKHTLIKVPEKSLKVAIVRYLCLPKEGVMKRQGTLASLYIPARDVSKIGRIKIDVKRLSTELLFFDGDGHELFFNR